jgi:succinate-semialdehyde dehydrogenase / glutarate-semialdehyde dehydrogenase
VRREFEERFVEHMSTIKMGDPLDETTQMGPLARHDLRDALHRQVEASIAKGARVLPGGAVPINPGAYYPPMVLTNVRKGMPAYEEELFGPPGRGDHPDAGRGGSNYDRQRYSVLDSVAA